MKSWRSLVARVWRPKTVTGWLLLCLAFCLPGTLYVLALLDLVPHWLLEFSLVLDLIAAIVVVLVLMDRRWPDKRTLSEWEDEQR